MARRAPSLADWRDLLTLVLRGRCRRAFGRLGLISPERQVAFIEADLPAFERLCAVVAPARF